MEGKFQNPYISLIVGPTAVGKTEIALVVAETLQGEIISADSRQVYQGMDIGTAKPTVAQRRKIPHHFVDELPPTARFSAGDFGIQARKVIQDIMAAGRIPIVVGGSGLYIRALMDGFFEGKSWDPDLRHELSERVDREGLSALYQEVVFRDPPATRTIMPNDRKRIIRALEIMELTGKPMTAVWKEKQLHSPFRGIWCGITMPRVDLYQRINHRVLEMIDQGLTDEVKKLLNDGVPPVVNAMNSVGYSETIQYLQGKINYDEMVELIQRHTRHFAKRQWSWFKRDPRIRWFTRLSDQDAVSIARDIITHIREILASGID
jgi:tRNA dimethylallyltransferase